MSSPGADFEKAIPRGCGQMVLLTAADWSASTATVRRFARTAPCEAWRPVENQFAALGSGLVWL